MALLTMQDFQKAVQSSQNKPSTPQQMEKQKELGQKVQKISYEERRRMTKKADEKQGFLE